jgi:hypothetical protein
MARIPRLRIARYTNPTVHRQRSEGGSTWNNELWLIISAVGLATRDTASLKLL